MRYLLLISLLLTASPAAAMSEAKMVELLQALDNRQRNSGDYKSLAFIEQKEKGKTDLVYEAVIYRRDVQDKLMILFTRPKAEAGKGYHS